MTDHKKHAHCPFTLDSCQNQNFQSQVNHNKGIHLNNLSSFTIPLTLVQKCHQY
jgi:hypothetical protein